MKGRAGVGRDRPDGQRVQDRRAAQGRLLALRGLQLRDQPELHTIQDPARLGWEPVVQVEHYQIDPGKILAARSSSPRPVPARHGRCKPGLRHHEARSSISDRMVMDYPKRLIEVDLPIKRICAHARREKSIRHGHISTLHIWWARRPLAACRAVICAALWPDPADESAPRPSGCRGAADHGVRREGLQHDMRCTNRLEGELRPVGGDRRSQGEAGSISTRTTRLTSTSFGFALLDFIADFANWDNSTVPAYLDTSRALTQAAHEALGGAAGTRPLVVDPFAGGGSIPLEALRVGRRRLRQRPQPRPRAAQQGRPRIHPQVRPAPRR